MSRQPRSVVATGVYLIQFYDPTYEMSPKLIKKVFNNNKQTLDANYELVKPILGTVFQNIGKKSLTG